MLIKWFAVSEGNGGGELAYRGDLTLRLLFVSLVYRRLNIYIVVFLHHYEIRERYLQKQTGCYIKPTKRKREQFRVKS